MSPSPRVTLGVVAAVLVLATISVYLPVAGHEFVEFDDPLYVTGNAKVAQGLTAESVTWALTSGDAFIWHPLTWISYLLDASLYGTQRAGPWLLTNVALHALNVVLLVVLLRALGATTEACAFGAALFALHPLQVESVAWVSARKEPLAGAFVLLAVIAYVRYARAPSPGRYAGVAVSLALALMAKGSHVALPFALLLLDRWPLSRLRSGPDFWQDLGRRTREKLPLLLLSFAAIGVNLAFVRTAHNVWVRDPDVLARAGAVLVNLTGYLGRLVWPQGLAIVYPNPLQAVGEPVTLARAGAAFALLALLTVVAARAGRTRGYWIVGWLFFLGMLLPMAGWVPMGLRTPHDRYAYVPMIGVASAFGFALGDLCGRSVRRRGAVVAAGSCVLLVLAATARRQVEVWKDSETLFDHALAVTERNAVVHHAKGTALARAGDVERGIAELEAALEIHPQYAASHHNLGYLLVQRGDAERGMAHLERALDVRPDWTRARLNLGRAQLEHADLDVAVATFERAVEGDPETASVRSALGVALLRAGRGAEAVAAFRAAQRLDPDDPTAARALAALAAP